MEKERRKYHLHMTDEEKIKYPKKHIFHMTKKEVEFLNKRILNIKSKSWMGYHVQASMVERNIRKEEIDYVLDNYQIVEFNLNSNDRRVLIREKSNRNRNVCLSLSLVNGNIVTCYVNNKTDKHFTLREEEYDKDLDIKRYLN